VAVLHTWTPLNSFILEPSAGSVTVNLKRVSLCLHELVRLTTRVLLLTIAFSDPALPQRQSSQQPVLYSMPGMDQVTVRSGVRYKRSADQDLEMTLYYPRDRAQTSSWPAVIFVFGYSDAAATRLTGAPLRQMGQYTTWPRIVAASGLVGITYATNQPLEDLRDLMRYVRSHAADLRIDARAIGLWACSANVPVALAYLGEAPEGLRTAVFYYGLMPTPDGYQRAQQDSLSNRLGFAMPEPHPMPSADSTPPLLLVRAGKDNLQQVKASIDHFSSLAVGQNVPLTLINYSGGRHAFDIVDDNQTTRDIIGHTLTFLLRNLQRQ
jgi:acetyl esterase/lipase